MTQIDVIREAGVRFQTDIRGHRLVFDQPIEDGGGDLGPTPTEVFVASLAGCVAYYATRFLERHGQHSDALGVRALFTMAARPSRVESVDLLLSVPDLPATLRAPLLAVVDHCTVHNSLRLAPAVHIELDSAPAAAAPADPMTRGASSGAGVHSTRP
jgi:putative redox protein